MKILKIGGSILTDKKSENTLDRDSFEESLDTVSDHSGELVLVHGAGSYGHPQAARTKLDTGTTEDVYPVHSAVKELNTLVLDYLEDNEVSAFPVHPSSCSRRQGDTVDMMSSQVKQMLENGVMPVLHGDTVITEEGFKVLSGDTVVIELASTLGIEYVGMCTTTSGVRNPDGEVMERIRSESDIVALGTENKDVTGGMPKKAERLLQLEQGGCIFGLEQLEAFLNGKEVGTFVKR